MRYKPSLSTQTKHSPLGMKGVYTVQFDVKRTESSGKSVVAGGYFSIWHFKKKYFFPKVFIFSNINKTILVTKTSLKHSL